ncbi:hypothetical protein HSBAA_58980 [Vreelandella sulfidaeris]|uniref:Uncharacterized protein n=1 Tax=Vreelandella sulfidaeris TaxID=115553 RepID=A0A455UE76_9GAMM|nr:hypothetical protein HSBAA_58980 [Halomonas sulfidaeris]
MGNRAWRNRPLLNTSLQGDDYLAAFDANVRELASRLGADSDAEEALEILHAEIESQREALSNALARWS